MAEDKKVMGLKGRKKPKEQEQSNFVTRKEFEYLLGQLLHLQKTVHTIDLLSATQVKVLLKHGLTTKAEIQAMVAWEQERIERSREIWDESKSFEERLQLCRELEVDPLTTPLPSQIKADTSTTLEEKLKLADRFGIHFTHLVDLKEDQEQSKSP